MFQYKNLVLSCWNLLTYSCTCIWTNLGEYLNSNYFFLLIILALDSLGFGNYKEDAMSVMQEAKAVAAKKRRGSSRLENLGIPEEELLRQQQELFAKVFDFI